MSILTTISGVPLFTTQSEALSWGYVRGLEGFHTHTYQGLTGFMGGIDHSIAVVAEIITPAQQAIINQTQQAAQTPPPPAVATPGGAVSSGGSSGSGSSGGGGGGY